MVFFTEKGLNSFPERFIVRNLFRVQFTKVFSFSFSKKVSTKVPLFCIGMLGSVGFLFVPSIF